MGRKLIFITSPDRVFTGFAMGYHASLEKNQLTGDK